MKCAQEYVIDRQTDNTAQQEILVHCSSLLCGNLFRPVTVAQLTGITVVAGSSPALSPRSL